VAAASLRRSTRSAELKIEHTLSYGKAHTDAVRRRRVGGAHHARRSNQSLAVFSCSALR